MNDEPLTRIVIDLPHHRAIGGEGMWARSLGGDLFELQNVPFYAYGLNYLDVVRAIAPEPSLKPQILELVHASGHSTLRIVFMNVETAQRRGEILESLRALGADPERADSSLCALDIPPGVSVDAVRDRLDELEPTGEVEYETCEARVAGSFDDHPR